MAGPDFSVLVVGGGSCGLALAQGLKYAGIPYTLYERDSEEDYHRRPRDWGSLLHWGAEYLEKCLPPDLWQRRSEMYVDPWNDYATPPIYWNAKTGEIIKRIEGSKLVRVSRRKVRLLLSEGLDIEFSKRLKSISPDGNGARAVFEDGTSAAGSLIVGCDGGRSAVREYIVGSEAATGFDTDITIINTMSQYTAKQALALRARHPIISTCYHPDKPIAGLIATLDIPSKDAPPETWKFQVYTSWRGAPRKADFETPADAMRFFKSRFAEMAEPFRSAGLAFSDDFTLPVDSGWNFKPLGDFAWDNHNGRVTVAGDAAHSMLPHRGQGLNNAIMDAAEILEAVKRVAEGDASLGEAIGAYEAEMRIQGSEEVDRTLEVAANASFSRFQASPMVKIGLQKAEKDQGKL